MTDFELQEYNARMDAILKEDYEATKAAVGKPPEPESPWVDIGWIVLALGIVATFYVGLMDVVSLAWALLQPLLHELFKFLH